MLHIFKLKFYGIGNKYRRANRRTLHELKRDGNLVTVQVDDEIYEVDALKVGEGIYSMIYKGKSYNMEMIEKGRPGITP